MATAQSRIEADDGEGDRWTIHRQAPPGLGGRLAARLAGSLRAWGYGSALYRWRLKGRHPLKLLASPDDPWPGDEQAGQALLAGTLTAGPAKLDLEEPHFWQRAASLGPLRERALSFSWLRDLARVTDQRRAQGVAEDLVRRWLEAFPAWHEQAWAPVVTARRLTFWLLHAPLILSSTDLVYRSAVLNSMARQARHLARTAADAPEGLPRIEAAVGLILSGLLLPHGAPRAARGEALLTAALNGFTLPDGGVASKQPDQAVALMQSLILLRGAYEECTGDVPEMVQHTLDRTAPFVRACLHEDGAPVHINGADRAHPGLVERVLEASGAGGWPIDNARQTGLQRLKARRTLLVLDAMPPPTRPLSLGAHAGTLAFELSDGLDRLIVNLGAAGGDLRTLARTTAAHSTLVLRDTNSTRLQPGGSLGRGVETITLERGETAEGLFVGAAHDGYARRFRLLHERRLTLARDGARLSGEDWLVPEGRGPGRPQPFDIRFHLHPAVTVSPTHGGRGVLLRLPSRHGWLFRLAEGTAAVEDSLYVDAGRARRSKQIVVHGEASRDGATVAWTLERTGKG